MKPELIDLQTSDGLTLPGLLYSAPRSKKAAIFLHGNGSTSIFYNKDELDAMAAGLAKRSVSFLAFNNRGAHMIKSLHVKKNGKDVRKLFGTAHEKIKECVQDIDGAITFLKGKGFEEFYLIGASTGANKICVYDHYKPNNSVSKYILLAGGDDTGSYFEALGPKKFAKVLTEAKNKARGKESNDIIKDLIPQFLFSYKGFYDIANPNGDYNTFPFYEALYKKKLSTKPLFRFFKNLRKPTLVMYGELDQYTYGKLDKIIELLKSQRPDFTYHIIKGADHGFHDHDQELAKIIVDWIK